MSQQSNDAPSNISRAMWVFLGYMLVGPFFAGLAVAVSLLVAPLIGMERWLPDPIPPVGPGAISAYVWAAIPAALAALMVIPLVLRIGRFGWIHAAAAGVAGFGLVAVVTGSPERDLLPVLAFIAGLVSIGVQQAMESGGVIEKAEG
ncbi:MAG: hypothetical protein K0U74_02480 [Alphaproteobacteria bacterium]|nr:hypothetical protein [Alphaproteobacteria bacterium]